MILIKLNVKNKSTLSVCKIVEKFGGKVLVDNGIEMIIEFSGTPIEISKLLKKLEPLDIIEQTRSGLVSMALGMEYIKK